MTKTMYIVVSEYPAIVRYDFAFWNRTIEAKGIMEKMENALACVAVKSAVDISKLAFNDFYRFIDQFSKEPLEMMNKTFITCYKIILKLPILST